MQYYAFEIKNIGTKLKSNDLSVSSVEHIQESNRIVEKDYIFSTDYESIWLMNALILLF